MHIDEGVIREYCKRMTAQIIFDTMECALPRRDRVDWDAACRIIDRHQAIVGIAARRIAEHCELHDRGADPHHYGTFEFVCHDLVWENVRLELPALPQPPYSP